MRWILASLITAAAVSALAERPERNSFIDYPIHSVADLVHQIKTDPAVADRYERNFSMNLDEVVQYVSGLHEARLPESGVYDVYSVPPDGHIKWHEQRLKKGVAIFADSSGMAVMLQKCGNPLVMSSPAPASAPAGPATGMVDIPPTQSEVPPTEMALAPAPATPEDLYVPPAAVVEATPAAVVAPVSSPNYAWLGFLAAGGLIYGLTTIHSGGHHTTPTPPVPEPSSMALMACGVTGLLFTQRRIKRSL